MVKNSTDYDSAGTRAAANIAFERLAPLRAAFADHPRGEIKPEDVVASVAMVSQRMPFSENIRTAWKNAKDALSYYPFLPKLCNCLADI